MEKQRDDLMGTIQETNRARKIAKWVTWVSEKGKVVYGLTVPTVAFRISGVAGTSLGHDVGTFNNSNSKVYIKYKIWRDVDLYACTI